MGERWKHGVEEAGKEEGVGCCGGDGYLEDGLVGHLKGSRACPARHEGKTNMIKGISTILDLIGMNGEEGQ